MKLVGQLGARQACWAEGVPTIYFPNCTHYDLVKYEQLPVLAEIVLPALRRVPSTGILIVIADMIMMQCIGVRARHPVVPYGMEGSIERDEMEFKRDKESTGNAMQEPHHSSGAIHSAKEWRMTGMCRQKLSL